MSELPNPADIFAFAVVFFPGFISLSIAIRFLEIKTEKIGAVEKIVVSFALSILVFFISGVSVNFLAPSQTLLSIPNLFAIFVVAVLLGCALAPSYYCWIYVEYHVLGLANRIRAALGLSLTPAPALNEALDLMWDNREKSYIVVANKEGQQYRGFLGMISFEPRIEIMITQHKGKKPERLENGVWQSIDEWTLIFTEDNISWIGAIAV